MKAAKPARGREKTGHGDTPRQDTQRPAHADHADAGGQESTNVRAARTQRSASAPPEAPLPAGRRHPDPPLPEAGRQAQRPGQDGRAEDRLGARDVDSLRSAEPEGFGGADRRAPLRGASARDDNAATRRSSRSATSSRRDRAVGAEEPPRPRRRR